MRAGEDEDPILSAAREVRPFLNDLLAERAEAVDDALVSCLTSSKDTPTRIDALGELFASSPELNDWIGQYLDNGLVPPEVVGLVSRGGGGAGSDSGAGYAGLPGDPTPVPGTRFTCPEGHDYTRYLMRRGEVLEQCPTHHCNLVRAD